MKNRRLFLKQAAALGAANWLRLPAAAVAAEGAAEDAWSQVPAILRRIKAPEQVPALPERVPALPEQVPLAAPPERARRR